MTDFTDTTAVASAKALTPTPWQFEGRNVRVIEKDGEPWLIATDVARELGYGEAKDLSRSLEDDEKGRHVLPTLGGDQEVTVISEPGLYRAIVQRRANKRHDAGLLAKIARFQRWVFHDVLPSIRKTGSYGAPAADPLAILNDPAAMRGLLLTYSEKVLTLESAVAEQRPKVEALERISETDGSLCITDAAKTLQIKPKDLFAFLRAHGWIYTRAGTSEPVAYQNRIITGLLEHKVTIVARQDGTEKTVTRVRVTPKGLARLAEEFALA